MYIHYMPRSSWTPVIEKENVYLPSIVGGGSTNGITEATVQGILSTNLYVMTIGIFFHSS